MSLALVRLAWFSAAAMAAAPADPLCEYFVTWTGSYDFERWGLGPHDPSDLVLEVELEGPTIQAPSGVARLGRVISAYQGWVESGYVWIEHLEALTGAVSGMRLVVFAAPTSPVTASPGRSVWVLGRSEPGVGPEAENGFGYYPRVQYIRRWSGRRYHPADVLLTTPLVACSIEDSQGFRCPYLRSTPWYGEQRETLRREIALPTSRLSPILAGAPPPDGVPIRAELAVAGVLPNWPFARDVYDDVVRVVLTHGETVDPLGHDGCRAFGTILSVTAGPRVAGDPIALRLPPPLCSFDEDLDRPVTWMALLEPTEDPRSDAAAVELLPLEPRVRMAETDALGWDQGMYAHERPLCGPEVSR